MEKYLTVSTVAETFSVTNYTVRTWIKEHKLKAFKVNGQWRIKESDMLDWAEKMYGEHNVS